MKTQSDILPGFDLNSDQLGVILLGTLDAGDIADSHKNLFAVAAG
jgi:hypothetical protein